MKLSVVLFTHDDQIDKIELAVAVEVCRIIMHCLFLLLIDF